MRTLALLLEKEERLPTTTAAIRARVAGTALEPQIADATAAILLARFTTRPIPEICAMGGITLEDFTQSVAYREILGSGRSEDGSRAIRPASWTLPSACCAAAPASLPQSRRPRSALFHFRAWKPSPKPCSTSRGRTI